MPALFTRTSSWPNAAMARATMRCALSLAATLSMFRTARL
jgi:hypothetical protein